GGERGERGHGEKRQRPPTERLEARCRENAQHGRNEARVSTRQLRQTPHGVHDARHDAVRGPERRQAQVSADRLEGFLAAVFRRARTAPTATGARLGFLFVGAFAVFAAFAAGNRRRQRGRVKAGRFARTLFGLVRRAIGRPATPARTLAATLANERIALLPLGLFAFGAAFPFLGCGRSGRLFARATAAHGLFDFLGIVAVVERGF